MEHFVARQPILRKNQKIYAYELLFRNGLSNYFSAVNGDEATSNVIANSFLLFGIDNLTSGAKAFINFTRELLVKDYATVLPKKSVVIEVLENVEPEADVVNACRKLKNMGYILALDDFIDHPRFEPLVELADIIKVDFMQSDLADRERLAEKYIPQGKKMLAEKVENRAEFDQAMNMGYSYFQGYFFSKPVIVSQKDIPSFKMNLMQLLREVNRSEMDFDRVTDMIQREVTLSYKLLRLVNSVAFGLLQKVTNIKQALAYLGEIGIRKWASILTMAGMADDKPSEIIVNSLIRARFCELLAEKKGLRNKASDLFLLGLFSQLDVIMGRPMKELMSAVHLNREIIEALLANGKYRSFLRAAIVFERGMWTALPKVAQALGVKEMELAQIYIKAVQWPKEMMSEV